MAPRIWNQPDRQRRRPTRDRQFHCAETGIAIPGAISTCPVLNSHRTCQLGRDGCIAWGNRNPAKPNNAMATGALRLSEPPQMRVTISGQMGPGVTAKDLALHFDVPHRAAGGKRCAIEFLTESSREPVPSKVGLRFGNLAVEFSALRHHRNQTRKFSTMVPWAPVRTKRIPGALALPGNGSNLKTDQNAVFDYQLHIQSQDVLAVGPVGETVRNIPGPVISPANCQATADKSSALLICLKSRGPALRAFSVAAALLVSCTNGRLSDLREAAAVSGPDANIAPACAAVPASWIQAGGKPAGLKELVRRNSRRRASTGGLPVARCASNAGRAKNILHWHAGHFSTNRKFRRSARARCPVTQPGQSGHRRCIRSPPDTLLMRQVLV